MTWTVGLVVLAGLGIIVLGAVLVSYTVTPHDGEEPDNWYWDDEQY